MDKRSWKPLALTLGISAASISYANADVDIDNDGLIEISTLEQLDLMRYDLAGTSLNGDSTGCPATGCNGYELVADLDFDTNGNGIADEGDQFWNGGEGWVPVGRGGSSRFTGNFIGNNYSIHNMMINNDSYSYSGLFGYTDNSTIKDLQILNAVISSGGPGILAGRARNGVVFNVKVEGDLLSGYNYAGALIGTAAGMIVEDVEVIGSVRYVDDSGVLRAVGGVIGAATGTTLNRVSFSGELDSGEASFAGGIIGFSQFNNFISDALVDGRSIVGSASSGGIVGESWGVLEINNSLFLGNLSAGNEVDPIVADGYNYADQITVTGSYWDAEVSGIYASNYGEPRVSSELKCPTMPSDANCDTSLYQNWNETIWFFGEAHDYPKLIRDTDGDGIHDFFDVDIDNDGLIEISTPEELDQMRNDLAGASLSGDSTGCPTLGCNGYELVADINFDTNSNGVADRGDMFWNDGKGWSPVGESTSRFTANFNGNNHVIRDIVVNNSRSSYTGLFGYAENSTMINVKFINALINGNGPGVLVGRAKNGTISQISVQGNVQSFSGYAGNLIGTAAQMDIVNIDATGSVSYQDDFGVLRAVGGIAGAATESNINQVSFSGELDSGEASFAGGVIGFSQANNFVSNAVVKSNSMLAYSTVGGIVGDSWGVLSVDNSLFIGALAASDEVAPIVANGFDSDDQVTISDSYWDSETTGIFVSNYGEPRTTSELQCPTMPGDAMCDASLYADWDETIWDFGTSSDYPVLR